MCASHLFMSVPVSEADAVFRKLNSRKMLLIRRIAVNLPGQGEFQKARQIV